MTLPHKKTNKTERENVEECHHPIRPSNIDISNPIIDIECNRKTEDQTQSISSDTGFSWMADKTLADIIDGDWDQRERAESNEGLANGYNNPVQMILERSTEKPEPNWVEDKCWDPEGVETIFWLPDTAIACADCERKSVAHEVSVDQGNYDAEPVNE
jgi:hypothetical protein